MSPLLCGADRTFNGMFSSRNVILTHWDRRTKIECRGPNCTNDSGNEGSDASETSVKPVPATESG
jgi:hypothetical protein